jgi:hypothetical protein
MLYDTVTIRMSRATGTSYHVPASSHLPYQHLTTEEKQMKKIFAIAMLASLMLFGCKSEEPKQPPAKETTTQTMKSSTTTAPAEKKGEEAMEKTTETKVMEKTTETQPAPAK